MCRFSASKWSPKVRTVSRARTCVEPYMHGWILCLLSALYFNRCKTLCRANSPAPFFPLPHFLPPLSLIQSLFPSLSSLSFTLLSLLHSPLSPSLSSLSFALLPLLHSLSFTLSFTLSSSLSLLHSLSVILLLLNPFLPHPNEIYFFPIPFFYHHTPHVPSAIERL